MYQNKVTSSLAAIQRPGHLADNCKMVYFQVFLFISSLPSPPPKVIISKCQDEFHHVLIDICPNEFFNR